MNLSADNLLVGLDIGTTKVCAVIGELNESGVFQVIGVGTSPSKGMRRGAVINIEATLKSVAEAVEAAEMMSGREVGDVVTSIGGAHIEGINSRGVVAVSGRDREITREDIRRVIEAAKAVVIPMDREVLHVLPQEYIVDDQGGIHDPLDMIGIRLEAEVHIIIGSVTSVENLLKCVNRAGFRVEEIVLESLAASAAVLSEDEKDLGVLLIDLGGGTTNFIVHLEGAPYHTDVISLGGSQVTSDLSIMLKTPIDSAEKIKKDAGCCYMPLVDSEEEVVIPGVGGWPAASIPRKEMCRIIPPRVAEMCGMVRDQLVKKSVIGHLGGGVVLTGGGSLLQGTIELAQEIFDVPARIGFPAKLGGLTREFQSPMYATAVGLVMFNGQAIQTQNTPQNSSNRVSEGFFDKMKAWMKEFF
jgi:cell division protein FtsA